MMDRPQRFRLPRSNASITATIKAAEAHFEQLADYSSHLWTALETYRMCRNNADASTHTEFVRCVRAQERAGTAANERADEFAVMLNTLKRTIR